MKRFQFVLLMLTVALVSASCQGEKAEAGIFGRGRGIFRGGWGSRNVGGGGYGCQSCGPACGPGGCLPAPSVKPAPPVAPAPAPATWLKSAEQPPVAPAK